MGRMSRTFLPFLLIAAVSATAQDIPPAGGTYAGTRLASLGASHVEAVDLDADGLTDLVVTNAIEIWLLRNLGDGRVEGTQHSLSPGFGGGASAVIEWNGDGLLDVAILHDGQVKVLLGDGAGGALGLVDVTLATSGPQDLEAADMNGDGLDDLVLAQTGTSGALVALADGSGGVAGTFLATLAPSATRVEVTDLDADGNLDVAFSTVSPGAVYTVRTDFGDGTGALALGQVLSPPWAVVSMDSGDLDEDGFPELVTNAGQIGNLQVWPNLGDGNLGPFQAVDMPTPSNVVVTDFDLDGHLDLLAASSNADELAFRGGDGAGAFTAGSTLSAGNNPGRFAVLEFDGDGLLDLALGGSGLTIHTGVGDAGLRLPFETDLGFQALAGLALGDLDGDGFAEAVTTSDFPDLLWVIEGTGTERFGAASSRPAGGQGGDVAIGDVTADGLPDVLVAIFELGGGVNVFANDGAGDLAAPVFHPTGNNTTALNLTDMDGDGSLDVLTADRASHKLSLMLADGVGGLGAPDSWPVGTQPSGLDVGDLDGDLVPDAVVASDGDTEMTVLIGRGGGSGDLDLGTPVEVGPDMWAVDLGDVDLDGDLDACLVNASNGRLKIFANDGAAGFAMTHNIDTPFGLQDVLVVDVDVDGVPDVVTSGFSAVSVHRGRDLVGYWPAVDYFAAGGNSSLLKAVLAVDLEGSGFPDLMTVSSHGTVSVLPHRGSPWWRLGGGRPTGPVLSPVGPLTPGSALTLDAWNGPAFGTLWLVLGLTTEQLPFGGGTLVPALDVLLPLPLDGDGELSLPLAWPSDLPPGIPFWLQPWLASPHTPGDALLGVTR
jgi:hypothetical protein